MSKVDVIHKLIKSFACWDIDSALDLYADNICLISEFSVPYKVEINGKETFTELMKAYPDKPKMYENILVKDVIVHQTLNENVLIAEWTYETPINDGFVINKNIIVVELDENNKIVKSRDYHNDITRAMANHNLSTVLENLQNLLPK